MSRVQRDAGILVLVAILLGVFAYFAFPLSKTHLGLDLQGGLAVILQAPADTTDLATKLDQAKNIIQNRINKLGVAEPEIQTQGGNKISVQLPGIQNPEEALSIIGKTAVLEFMEVNNLGTAYASEADALKAANVSTEDELAALSGFHEVVHWSAANGNPAGDKYYLVTTQPTLTGAMLKGAQQSYESTSNKPKVDMQFNSEGSTIFDQLTKKMADTATITGKDQLLAIVLDGEVESAPRVQEEISGGNAEITGNFTLDEAKSLALVLQTGALPVKLTQVSTTTVGATLGKSALRQALIAGLIGILLIMVFMTAYYRLLGLVASAALIIYTVLFLGLLNAIGVTMTLPGIAGMIITLGMAVDANVLIFARMRDEVGGGKTVPAATSAGFRKAFRAVFDCNMTTIITAIILFWAATGGIKGFALTLGIGVALSMFTAVLVTRSMLSLLSGWRPFRNLKLLGLHIPKGGMTRAQEGSRP